MNSKNNMNRIKFEEFPGNKKNGELFKNKYFKYLVIIIFFILLIGSGFFNYWLLNKSEEGNYKKINDFKENYATIYIEERKDLFQKMGFSNITNDKGIKDGKEYDMTYGDYKKYNGFNMLDSINVYFDNNEVDYINLNLIYKLNEFKTYKVLKESNSILKNFIEVNLNDNVMTELKNNDYYFLKDDNLKANFIFKVLPTLNDDYITLNIVFQKDV